MKMYRLDARGSTESFTVKYFYSDNFMDYHEFEYTGSEQEKFNKFLIELKNNILPQPIYIGVKMVESKIDRALSRSEVFNTKDINKLITKIIKYNPK
ncbi:MAG: hypothetical protein AB6733_04220 [Clostridiaceae bacterium]